VLPVGQAQQPAPAFFQRLPTELLEVAPPAVRVRGEPGRFSLQTLPCRPEAGADIRRRIVDLAVQEWAFFGFSILDETDPATWVRSRRSLRNFDELAADPDAFREVAAGQAAEAARVAPSIAGYWAVAAEGSWIVERHNDAWRASSGTVPRWRDPWSAAFVSWVMCEAGVGDSSRFQQAVAHHKYIDQAIKARDGAAPDAMFVAQEIGEAAIVPGDMVCLARRPYYRTLEDRRSQMGVGARTHCDVVVKVDEQRELIVAIGGNVRGTVGLKLLPAERRAGGPLQPIDRASVRGARSHFAHLKLRAEPIAADAFDTSATLAALACTPQITAVSLPAATAASARDC
jgi:hypothetical protein